MCTSTPKVVEYEIPPTPLYADLTPTPASQPKLTAKPETQDESSGALKIQRRGTYKLRTDLGGASGKTGLNVQ